MPGDRKSEQYPAQPITGNLIGLVTGTLYPFSAIQVSSVQLVADPSNSGTAWVISNPGSIGYPLIAKGESLYLDAVDNMSMLQGYFEKAGDKICYCIQKDL